jgi:cellulose synthase/poly-beta-1,6-N-acetylglucosamine synthase-like glycosyltransferase
LKPNGVFCFSAVSGGSGDRGHDEVWGFNPRSGEALAAWLRENGFDCVLLESRVLPGDGRRPATLLCVLAKSPDVGAAPDLTTEKILALQALVRPEGAGTRERGPVLAAASSRVRQDQSGEIARLRKVVEQRQARVRELTIELATTINEMRALKKSPSWKITKPLRKIASLSDVNTIRSIKFDKRLSKLKRDIYIRNYKIFSTSKRYRKYQIKRNINFGLEEARGNNWKRAIKFWNAALELYGKKTPSSNDGNFLRYAVKLGEIVMGATSYKERIARYRAERKQDGSSTTRGPRVAVCSAILGGYDSLKVPLHLDEGIDYILYTDKSVDDTGIFEVRPVEYFDTDVTRASRYVKTHPHTLFSDYDVAIWIDANVTVLGSLWPMIDKFLASGMSVGGIPHPVRTSIYVEAAVCIELAKDSPEIIESQIEHYKAQNFDASKMVEANVLFFNLRDRRLPFFLNTWWNEIDRYSKRDQLSFNYALQAAGLDWHRLMEHPLNTRNYPSFALLKHDSGDGIPERFNAMISRGHADPYGGSSYAEVRDSRISGQRNRTIDVVVRIHDGLRDVEGFLDAVLQARQGSAQRLILVDDGSKAKIRSYLNDFLARETDTLLHRFESPCGQVLSDNVGVALSSADMVVLLDGDTKLSQGWAEKMADALFSKPSTGVVGPLSNASEDQFFPLLSGPDAVTNALEGESEESLVQINALCERVALSDVLPRVPVVDGPCLGFSRAAIDGVGVLDERFFPGGFCTRADFCFRVAEAGFGVVLAMHTYVMHRKPELEADAQQNDRARQAEWNQLKRLHGAERVSRAVDSLGRHPLLSDLRAALAELDRDVAKGRKALAEAAGSR